MKKENPFPIKEIKGRQKQLAEEWATNILNSEEGKELQRTLNKELLDFIIFGKTPQYGNKEFFKDLKEYTKTELELTPSQIIESFKDYLTEEEIKQLENYGR